MNFLGGFTLFVALLSLALSMWHYYDSSGD